MSFYVEGQRGPGNTNTETFNTLLNILRQPASEEELRLLSSTEYDEEETSDVLTAEERAELEAIEAEIDAELRTKGGKSADGEAEWQEQLDALVMTQARGVGALLGFAQNTMRPNWIRAKAMQEVVRRADGNEHALLAGTFHFGPGSFPADAPCVLNVDGLILEKDQNEVVHAECLTRRGNAGFALTMDLAREERGVPIGENAFLHVTLFDRQSGNSFRSAVARLEQAGDSQYHVDLFDPENLSLNELERADALFWVERKDTEE